MARNRSEHVPEWLHRAEATHLHLKVCVEADGQDFNVQSIGNLTKNINGALNDIIMACNAHPEIDRFCANPTLRTWQSFLDAIQSEMSKYGT